ncbi:MAG: hypothetical protein WC714_29160 [Candidatus Obscuribacterales bacterium]|jgi:hypothetical protein
MGNWSSKPVVLDPIEFDGDQVVVTVKRLLMEDMQAISKYFDREKGVMRFDSPLEVCKAAADIMPKYVVGVDGMMDDAGGRVTLEDFHKAVGEFYLVPLFGAIFQGLVFVSTAKAKEKNSAPPSQES